MDTTQLMLYIMGGTVGLFAIIVVAYFILRKKMQGSDYKEIVQLQKGTKSNKYSSEVLFQKLYLTYTKIPVLKRYVLKLRRRLEIINVDDEYATRRDSAKILTKT